MICSKLCMPIGYFIMVNFRNSSAKVMDIMYHSKNKPMDLSSGNKGNSPSSGATYRHFYRNFEATAFSRPRISSA